MITVLIAVGGALGAVLRFAIDHAANARFDDERPLGVLAVNIIGSLAVGLAVGSSMEGRLADDPLQVIAVGILGGFTTFSTVAVDTVLLGRERTASGVVYVLTNVAASVTAAAVGMALTGAL